MLEPGSSLGPYQIAGLLGAGGMGEVYRARDTRLGREVALKILPAEMAQDPARRARFEQEARAAGALNHPNILTIHDFGVHDGHPYLVMELVDGESLRALLARGPLALRKFLDLAAQIADGMAAAHAAHITHRDLKPENIMVTPDGRAKILDFGLARQAAPPAPGAETVTAGLTSPGMVLGTVNYMSPEQVRGLPADFRSDQFSFGAVLYEMISGKAPFRRDEPVQTMSAVLTDDPPPLDPRVPPPLRWVVDRCLAKDPRDRYESTRDLFQDLRSLRDHVSETLSTEAPAVAAPRARRRWLAPAAVLAALLAGAAAGILLAPRRGPGLAAYRFTPLSLEAGGQGNPVWSSDGKSLAYAVSVAGIAQVFLRQLNAETGVPLTHAAEPCTPIAFAPDGTRVYYSTRRGSFRVWSVSVVGGQPEPVLSSDSAFAADLSPDGRTVALLGRNAQGAFAVFLSSPPGAPLREYTPAPFATNSIFNTPTLKFSPGGRSLLLIVNRGHEEEGWLLPFPPGSGTPRRVLPGLPGYAGTPRFSWMPDGRRVVLSLTSNPTDSAHLWLARVDSGRMSPLTAGTISESGPAVSPDGHAIAFVQASGNYDVVSVSIEDASVSRLLESGFSETMPDWAPQRPLLAYVRDERDIWLRNEDGSSRPLVSGKSFPSGSTRFLMTPEFSPDGARVIYNRVDETRGSALWISAVSGGTPVRLTAGEGGGETAGTWSPDGNWYVYFRFSDDTMFKVKTTGQAAPEFLKTGVDSLLPSWSPAGDWIAYHSKDHWRLISPDGKQDRDLGNVNSPSLTFSSDGQRLYGIRFEGRIQTLFWMDPAGGAVHDIGPIAPEFRPASPLNPGVHFSLSPDGKSLAYSVANSRSGLWLLEGFE